MFDLVGKTPALKIMKKSHHKTYLGMILTTLIPFIIYVITKDQIDKYIHKTYPQISVDYMIEDQALNFDFESKNPIMFSYAYLDAKSFKIVYVPHDDSISSPIINYLDIIGNEVEFKGFDLTEKCNMTEIDTLSKNKTFTNGIEDDFWISVKNNAVRSYCFPKNQNNYANMDYKNNGRTIMINVHTNILDQLSTYSNSTTQMFILLMYYSKSYLSPGIDSKFYTKRLEWQIFFFSNQKSRMYNIDIQREKTNRIYKQLIFEEVISDTYFTLDKLFLSGN